MFTFVGRNSWDGVRSACDCYGLDFKVVQKATINETWQAINKIVK